ncbi:hypothetical protein ACFVYE_32185 [Streptomyces sp. NPDC058239]|uniref:hypothetical protein n=1 Tax=Streptomyces sp. NPDC058239 TaxID=3346395 RepID=UPI0036DFB514
MTNIQNPTNMTDYDWLEFVGFVWKVENEGYSYASKNYAPKFETSDLAGSSKGRGLKALYKAHVADVETWSETVGYKAVDRIWSAHLREEKERSEAHLLWAVHPGGDWNYAAYSHAFATREDAEKWISGRAELAEKHGWKPWAGRLLHRETAGGEWAEASLTS